MHETSATRSFRLQPLTTSICVVAVGASLWWWSGGNADAWFMDFRGLRGQGWRLFSSCFLHINWLHLLFNLYWVGVFGERIETVFGKIRTAGIVALLAVGSTAAEYGFANSGVGLSGIGYGMFGLLWVPRPYLNFTDDVGYDVAAVGYTELERGNAIEAERLFRRAVAIQPLQADWQYNLGVSLARLERPKEAIAAFERAGELAPENENFQTNLAAWRAWRAGTAGIEGNVEQATVASP